MITGELDYEYISCPVGRTTAPPAYDGFYRRVFLTGEYDDISSNVEYLRNMWQ